jgi:hypothetical protein
MLFERLRFSKSQKARAKRIASAMCNSILGVLLYQPKLMLQEHKGKAARRLVLRLIGEQ